MGRSSFQVIFMGRLHEIHRHQQLIPGIGAVEIQGAVEAQVHGLVDKVDLLIPVAEQDAFAVHTFRGCSQAKQNLWLVAREQFLVGRGRRMVEFVHNNVIVKVQGGFGGEILGVKGLDGEEQVVDIFWLVIAYKQLAKVGVLQNGPEGIQALLQYIGGGKTGVSVKDISFFSSVYIWGS